MAPRVGVVLFPGSNCEQDVVEAVRLLGGDAEILWHGDGTVNGVDAVVVPGGFSYGDYLRAGAIARFAPMMDAVVAFAESGGPVLGICNGFQVLTEAGLLPGALQKNRGLKFLCSTVELRVDSTRSVLTSAASDGAILRVPINHFEGNYTCSPETLAELRRNEQSVLRYVDNPNGSLDDIAGITNEAGNVVGLMPHPERAISPLLGSDDGVPLLSSLVARGVGGLPSERRAGERGTGPAARGPVPRTNDSGRAADPGPAEHVGAHADGPEGRVADLLALGVAGGGLHELLLERIEVDTFLAEGGQFALQVHLLLRELELVQRAGIGQFGLDRRELLSHGGLGALASPLGLGRGKCFEIRTHGISFLTTFGQGGLVVVGRSALLGLLGGHAHHRIRLAPVSTQERPRTCDGSSFPESGAAVHGRSCRVVRRPSRTSFPGSSGAPVASPP